MRDVETDFHSPQPTGKIGLTYVLCPKNTGADFEQLLAKYFPGARVFHDPYLLMEGLLEHLSEARHAPVEGMAGSVVIHLQALFASEMRLVGSIREACPGMSIYLAGTDGRPQWLAAGLQQGASGLLTTGGVMELQPHVHGRNGHALNAPVVNGNGANGHNQPELANGSHPAHGSSAALSVNLHVSNKTAGDKPNGVSAARTVGNVHGVGTGLKDATDQNTEQPVKAGLSNGASGTIVEEMDDPDVPLHSPGEPVLTAEELRALLSADPA